MSRAPAPAPSTPSRPEPLGPDRGLGLLYRFLAATAVVVAALLVVEAVGESWVLVPAMAIHLFVTYVVISAIARLMEDGDGE